MTLSLAPSAYFTPHLSRENLEGGRSTESRRGVLGNVFIFSNCESYALNLVTIQNLNASPVIGVLDGDYFCHLRILGCVRPVTIQNAHASPIVDVPGDDSIYAYCVSYATLTRG